MIHNENTIRELVNNNYVYQLLSDKLDIADSDHSKTFAEVCLEKNIDLRLVETLIKAYDDSYEFPYEELNQLSTAALVKYLQASHSYYLRKKLPEIEQTAIQVFRKFYETYPLYAGLCLFFTEYKKKLEAHIRYEEEKFFPYVNELLRLHEQGASQNDIAEVLGSFSTAVFIENHSHVEEELQQVRKIILAHSPENKLPLPYKVFLNQLHYFEIELTKHAIVEDEVLIAKVSALEAELRLKAVVLH